MPSTDLALVAHLMRRAGFGATRAELEDYATQSYEATVEDLLHPERFPEVADDIVVRYWLELNNPDSVEPWNTRWLYRMVNTARPLEEKMALVLAPCIRDFRGQERAWSVVEDPDRAVPPKRGLGYAYDFGGPGQGPRNDSLAGQL